MLWSQKGYDQETIEGLCSQVPDWEWWLIHCVSIAAVAATDPGGYPVDSISDMAE